jgi:hypothetical protein
MPTIPQTRANRANAQLSTGPRTETGKARSAQNSLTHGLTARAIILPTEDRAAYQRHKQEFFDEYQPKGATEKQLVQSLADAGWRLNRVNSLEDALFAVSAGDEASSLDTQIRTLSSLSMHGHRLSRQFERTLQQLRQVQKERVAAEQHQLYEAADLLEMDQEKGVPFDPAADGFVLSKQEIETHIRRVGRAKQAAEAARERKYADNDEEEEE